MAGLDALAALLVRKSRDRRWIQGIAGIPGSGKSTVAEALAARLDGIAALVPMDGFHFDNQTLERMGRRDYKGAPATFDFDAYVALLRQLRSADGPVCVPVYDRKVHGPVPGPAIEPSVRVIITEGNYLLLDQPPWSELAEVLDGCWYLDTPIDEARPRIIERHVAGGRSPDDARRHYLRNDLPNARLVIACRRAADEVLDFEQLFPPAGGMSED